MDEHVFVIKNNISRAERKALLLAVQPLPVLFPASRATW